MKIELFYDKDCPFCNFYANYLKLKEKHELILFNVRECETQIDEFKTKGFDINDGYIIRVNDKNIYQGMDAIIFLNNLTEKKVYFPDNYFFRNIVYPLIKQFRKFILLIRGKSVDL